jgi:hypothetical protein
MKFNLMNADDILRADSMRIFSAGVLRSKTISFARSRHRIGN